MDPTTFRLIQGASGAASSKTDIVMGVNGTPYIEAYEWDDGFGTKYSDPSTLPTNAVVEANFNKAGDVVGFAQIGTPYCGAYPWESGTGFGTRFSDPGTLPPGNAYSCDFSPDDNYVLMSFVHMVVRLEFDFEP